MLTLVPSKGSKSSFLREATPGGGRGANRGGGVTSLVEDHDSWPTRFQPHAVKDVALSPQSRGKVKAWLEKALADHAKFGDNPGFRPHVLALCGNSGCGKSTLVEALCREMKVDVVTWSEDSWDIDMKGCYSGVTSRDAVDRLDEVDDMTIFVRHSAYPQLDLGGGEASSSSKKLTSKAKKSRKSAMVVDSEDEGERSARRNRQKIVLMHDLPHSYTVSYNGDTSKADDLAALMSSFRDPVVLIVSDIRGADDVQYAAKKLVPQSVRERVTFESIFQNPPTVRLMVKGLERILRECAPAKRALQRSIGADSDLEAVLRELAESSVGDMRHAVLELGFMASVQRGGEAINVQSRAVSNSSRSKRPPASSRNGLGTSGRAGRKGKEGTVFARKKARTGKGASVLVVDLTQSSHDDGDDTEDFMSSSDDGVDEGDGDGGGGGGGGDGDGDGRFHVAVDAKEGRERDPLYSSLHASGKLVMATLDKDGHFSFPCEDVTTASSMDTEMLFLFVQQNLLEGFITTQRVEQFGRETGAQWELMDLQEATRALEYCSDVDRFIHVKYDPNALHDRGALNLFPDAYVRSLVARTAGASRGSGSTERVAAGKERGTKLDFIAQRRPQCLDLATKRAQVASAITALNRERMRSGGSRHTGDGGGVVPPLTSVREVASSMAPLLSQMFESQQRRRAMDASAVYGGSSSSTGSGSGAGSEGLTEGLKFRVQELRRAMGAAEVGAQLADPATEAGAGAGPDDSMRPVEEPLYLDSDDIEMADSDDD